jgi:hypothetical protein
MIGDSSAMHNEDEDGKTERDKNSGDPAPVL